MKKWLFFGVTGLFLFLYHAQVLAQCVMIIPSDSMVMQEEDRQVKVMLSYSHPFEGKGMDLAKEVSTRMPYEWAQGTWSLEGGMPQARHQDIFP